MDIETAVRRLRRLVSDTPRGYSRSAPGFVTDITGLAQATIGVSISGSAEETITLTLTGLNTGVAIAAALQAAIRAHMPSDPAWMFATVTFNSQSGFTISNGDIGTDTNVIITTIIAGDVADALKLGLVNAGIEGFSPAARNTDDDLAAYITYALQSWNASVSPEYQYSLDTLTDSKLTPILYMAWYMVLEADAGKAVYSYRTVLGGDTLDLSDVFRNILDMLSYLSARIDKMRDELGIGNIFVSELTRYDRVDDALVPEYVRGRMPKPTFLQLVRLDGTHALVEWQEIRVREFSYADLYTSASPGIVDKSLLTSDPTVTIPVSAVSTKQLRSFSGLETVTKVTSSGVVYFVVIFADTRGQLYYSDEYSLDLNDANASPVFSKAN